ncbi:hypothetical protein H6G17_18685 [Chroococcidiopsis sp. FACHB-1243]|uniref:hypothetical protein n=1 Tax=Chroococcidiopsis sp. [FACHB-1243] TaxID=2692781 RepID=UPI00177E2063|nr:hypothetical protein [Chroococcidiopsis sp. [FACHB-1243]]MBD2307503.1 hypothetical protein [Chroococcidiopsis sp. [FACHB-1243]]
MLSARYKNNQVLVTSIIAVTCVVGIAFLQQVQIAKLKSTSQTKSLQALKQEAEIDKKHLNLMQQLPSFGFKNLVADFTFLKFLQYFGDESTRNKIGYGLSPEYFQVIIERDPFFLEAYRFLSSSTTLYAGMPERTIALIDQGLKHISPQVPSKSYYVWRYKGTDELLFLGNSQAAKDSYETAAEWASFYSDIESKNVASLSRQSAHFLATNPKSKLAQASAWILILDNAFDELTRKSAIARIQALGGKISITPEGAVNIQLPQQD